MEWTSNGPGSSLEGGTTRGGRSMTIIGKFPANCCNNCHFLAKNHIERGGAHIHFHGMKKSAVTAIYLIIIVQNVPKVFGAQGSIRP